MAPIQSNVDVYRRLANCEIQLETRLSVRLRSRQSSIHPLLFNMDDLHGHRLPRLLLCDGFGLCHDQRSGTLHLVRVSDSLQLPRRSLTRNCSVASSLRSFYGSLPPLLLPNLLEEAFRALTRTTSRTVVNSMLLRVSPG